MAATDPAVAARPRPSAVAVDGDDAPAAVPTWLERNGLHVALAVAWVATLGSLYFSEVRGYVPCPLCWYQRILMYPLAIILPLGLWWRDRAMPRYAIALAAAGWCISSYHLLIERGVIAESSACKIGVSCAVRYINWFGFVTIPLLAWTAFVLIVLGSSAVHRSGSLDDVPADRPWRSVLGIVGTVGAVFAVLWRLRL